MAYKSKDQEQIIRKDTKGRDGVGAFIEVMNTAFGIGQVLLRFRKYNENRPKGQRFTDQVDVYLSFDQFLRISDDLLETGFIAKELVRMKDEGKYSTYNLYMGGTNAIRLQNAGRARPDGKCEARTLDVQLANLPGYAFVARSGPGHKTAQGLFAPDFGNSPEQNIFIALRRDAVRELFTITKMHIQAYINAEYIRRIMHPKAMREGMAIESPVRQKNTAPEYGGSLNQYGIDDEMGGSAYRWDNNNFEDDPS